MIFKGKFFDGQTATEKDAQIHFSSPFIYVAWLENGFRKELSFRISECTDQADGDDVILNYKMATLIISKSDWKRIKPANIKHWKRYFAPAALSLTIITSMLYWHDELVTELTNLVPESIFTEAAKNIKKELQAKSCLNDQQEKILKSVFLRLGKNRDEFTIYLIPSSEKNAYAMPGNTIVFHDVLLKELDSLEAFTGILAHEIAHIENDHLKRQVVKTILFEWAAMAFFGDGSQFIRSLLAGKYNQAEEQEADREAAATLDRAEIDPRGIRNFFGSREEKENVMTKYLVLSHPNYKNRMKTFESKKKQYLQMDKKDWEVLKAGCHRAAR